MKNATVAQLMTKSVVSLPGETTVMEAAKAMRSQQIGDVVVVDRGRVAGLVTDRDIVLRAVAEAKDPTSTPLADIVSTDLVTINEDAPAAQAADLMRDKAIRRLIVTGSDGSLSGIVSLGDLAEKLDPRSALADISAAPPSD